jgi:predicted  nucleic acid-binding Zn-ribbon protein
MLLLGKALHELKAGIMWRLSEQKIIALLNEAVQAADANTKHALDVSLKLSRQLQAAEERITHLEDDLKHYKDRTERAEKWLNFISSEIEQKFFGSADHVRREA